MEQNKNQKVFGKAVNVSDAIRSKKKFKDDEFPPDLKSFFSSNQSQVKWSEKDQ